MQHSPVELITRKRDGAALSPDQVKWLVRAYTEGSLPDYQMSAFLMAAFIQGMNEEETSALTDAMLYSGQVLDLSHVPGIKVDKHSTGGVGDKISLPLAPIVAACGVPVPMISGRGLGHTGGTLDKLESIPGFRVDLTTEEYVRQLERIGIVMIGQTAEIAPADRKVYALRDVTGTVEFIPFIAASIMSKKLAEGIDALVLDVKCGRGAFMKREEDARRLAEALVSIGERFGKRAVARMTAMDTPLGYAAGNWPEVAESIRCLRGEVVPGVTEITLTLAAEMICLGGQTANLEEGRSRAQRAIDSGDAFAKLAELVEAQGGDVSVLEQPERRSAAVVPVEVRAPGSTRGYISDIDAMSIAKAALALGSGRLRKEDAVDPLAGVVLAARPGDPAEPGMLLARLYTQQRGSSDEIAEAVRGAFRYSEEQPAPERWLLARYAEGTWE